nr:VOC family protein [Pseudomonas aeruginosa]
MLAHQTPLSRRGFSPKSVSGISRPLHNASVWSGAGARFVVLTPADGDAATVGNGVTIGFVAPSRAAVNEFHRLALLAGGTDAGAPGLRDYGPNVYAAYVRDLEGHKIVVSCMSVE